MGRFSGSSRRPTNTVGGNDILDYQIVGLTEVASALRKFPAEVKKDLPKSKDLKKALVVVQKQVQAEIQVGRLTKAGSLRKSVKPMFQTGKKGRVGLLVGGDYWQPVERHDLKERQAIVPRTLISGRRAGAGYAAIARDTLPIFRVLERERKTVIDGIQAAVNDAVKDLNKAFKQGRHLRGRK